VRPSVDERALQRRAFPSPPSVPLAAERVLRSPSAPFAAERAARMDALTAAATDLEEAARLNELCGARVTINVGMPWSSVRYPHVSQTPIRREAYDSARPVPEDFFAASVVPEDALLVTLLVTAEGATFVDTHQKEGVLFMARPRYQLRSIVSPDTIVHGFMYADRMKQPRLGLFDANRVGGEDLSTLAPLLRHQRVYEMCNDAAARGRMTEYVQYHGVFYEVRSLTSSLSARVVSSTGGL